MIRGLIVKSVTLNNFRNYEEQTINFEKGINVVYGKNGQGKTNILESLFMCSTAKSPRTSNYKELINIDSGKNFFVINMAYNNDNLGNYIKIKYDNRIKSYVYNDILLQKTGELMTKFNSVLFTPEDLYIIKGGPDQRRKFLDMFICQTNKSYFYLLQKYNRLIKQKNIFLKTQLEKAQKGTYLDVLNEYIADVATKIVNIRYEILEKIQVAANIIQKQITGGMEKISLDYITVNGKLKLNLERNIYLDKLNQYKEKECVRKTCLVGPHRDDIDIKIDGMEAKEYGSQGQIRTAVLSLKLSLADIIEDNNKVKPVILLDDVLSELDIFRQEAIMQKFRNNQIIITCTDKEKIFYDQNDDINYIFVQKGKIIV